LFPIIEIDVGLVSAQGAQSIGKASFFLHQNVGPFRMVGILLVYLFEHGSYDVTKDDLS